MQPTNQSIETFIATIADTARQEECRMLVALMQAATKEQPVMWGSSIVGFGSEHYKYDSGREGDTMIVGFSPRKQAIVLYGVLNHADNAQRVETLGKHKLGKGCIYINHLSDVDASILTAMVQAAFSEKSA